MHSKFFSRVPRYDMLLSVPISHEENTHAVSSWRIRLKQLTIFKLLKIAKSETRIDGPRLGAPLDYIYPTEGPSVIILVTLMITDHL